MEGNRWFYESFVKDNALVLVGGQSFIYDMYFKYYLGSLSSGNVNNQLVILNDVYERYMRLKVLMESTLDKFDVNVFYRDFIRFKEKLLEASNRD